MLLLFGTRMLLEIDNISLKLKNIKMARLIAPDADRTDICLARKTKQNPQ